MIGAAERGLLDLAAAFAALRATDFRYPATLLDALLEEHQWRTDGEPP